MAQVKFSPLTPDFDDILETLQNDLRTRESWTDILTAGTGETLTEFIASVGAFAQEAVERAQQEVILDTALIPTSIYRITRMLGVHILRKRPAQVSARILRDQTDMSTQVSIPAYTQFIVDDAYFYNRVPIIVNIGQFSADTTLYQGQLFIERFTSLGTPFQVFRIGPNEFSLSDTDLFAYVGNERTIYKKTTRGLWHLDGGSNTFYENTLPNGQVEVIFGNNIYAAQPGLDVPIEFWYALTAGKDYTRAEINLNIQCSDFPQLTGQTLGPVIGGDSERPVSFYKIMAPYIWSAHEKAVTRDDHRAIACEYPGVLDAIFQGQAEVNPADLRWMNVVKVFLLTDVPWIESQRRAFAQYMQRDKMMATCQLIYGTPRVIPMDIDIKIFCFNRVDLNSAISLINQRLTLFFTPELGTLGRSVWISDLNDVIKSVKDGIGPLVDYVDINQPTSDAIVHPTDYIEVGNITIAADYAARREATIQGL